MPSLGQVLKFLEFLSVGRECLFQKQLMNTYCEMSLFREALGVKLGERILWIISMTPKQDTLVLRQEMHWQKITHPLMKILMYIGYSQHSMFCHGVKGLIMNDAVQDYKHQLSLIHLANYKGESDLVKPDQIAAFSNVCNTY